MFKCRLKSGQKQEQPTFQKLRRADVVHAMQGSSDAHGLELKSSGLNQPGRRRLWLQEEHINWLKTICTLTAQLMTDKLQTEVII